MSRESHEHHSDEFGKRTTGSLWGLDAPIIGAPTMVTLDGLVEKESGKTPSPWSLSVKTIVIALVVMFIIGAVLLALAIPIATRGMRDMERVQFSSSIPSAERVA
jgi:hypothetical protein